MSWNKTGPSDWNTGAVVNGDTWDTGAATNGDTWDTGAATNGDTWDTGVAANDGANDKWDDTAGAIAKADSASGDASYTGGDARMHVPNGDFESGGGGGGGDDSCRNCGGSGHFARECPEPRKQSGNCFNCDRPGHNKVDCPNERVDRPFTGICRLCEKEGHPASQCPDKPAEICKICKKEGHKALDCKGNRLLDWSKVADKTPDDAWEGMKVADGDRDLDDLREAVKVYVKAVPDTTYEQLERAYRQMHFQVYLIASEKEITDTFTLVNFQGKQDCKYTVGYFFSDKPPRSFLKEGWPANPEENLERLKDAGIPMDRGIPKCSNCNELGHIAKHCKEEKATIDRVEVKCVNCEEIGHRARDCTKARTDRYACHNCKQSGHSAAECVEPRSAEGIECKRCSEVGHFSKDCPTGGSRACHNCFEEGHVSKECPKPKNPDTVTCRNCEKMGHFSKDCPEPKDWSKVKCSNCGEMGHTIKRCKEPLAADGGAGNGEFGKVGFDPILEQVASGGDWDTGATTGGDWDVGATTGVAW